MPTGKRVIRREVEEWARLRDAEGYPILRIAQESNRNVNTVRNYLEKFDNGEFEEGDEVDENTESKESTKSEAAQEKTKHAEEVSSKDEEKEESSSQESSMGDFEGMGSDDDIINIPTNEFYKSMNEILQELGMIEKSRNFILKSVQDVPEWQTPQGMRYFLINIRNLHPIKVDILIKRLFSKNSGPDVMSMPGQMGQYASPYQHPGVQTQYSPYGSQGGSPFQPTPFGQVPGGSPPGVVTIDMLRAELERRDNIAERKKREEDEKKKAEDEKAYLVQQIEELKKAINAPKPVATIAGNELIEINTPIKDAEGNLTGVRTEKVPRDIYEQKMREEAREKEFQRTVSLSMGKNPQESEVIRQLNENRNKMQEMMEKQRTEMEKFREDARKKEEESRITMIKQQQESERMMHQREMKDMEHRMKEHEQRLNLQMRTTQMPPRSDPNVDLALQDMRMQHEKSMTMLGKLTERLDSMGDKFMRLASNPGNKPANVASEQWTEAEQAEFKKIMGAGGQ